MTQICTNDLRLFSLSFTVKFSFYVYKQNVQIELNGSSSLPCIIPKKNIRTTQYKPLAPPYQVGDALPACRKLKAGNLCPKFCRINS
ncbi:hypothetical protein XENTR_v10004737 [Xenopus tropicalis]|nr:hypothetical protein XENTR_v10004737 [Xenopus tropicalis]